MEWDAVPQPGKGAPKGDGEVPRGHIKVKCGNTQCADETVVARSGFEEGESMCGKCHVRAGVLAVVKAQAPGQPHMAVQAPVSNKATSPMALILCFLPGEAGLGLRSSEVVMS